MSSFAPSRRVFGVAVLILLSVTAYIFLTDDEQPVVPVVVEKSVQESNGAEGPVGGLDSPSGSRFEVETEELATASTNEASPDMPRSYRDALGGLVGRVVENDGTPVPDFGVEIFGVSMGDFFIDPASSDVLSGPDDRWFLKGTTRTDIDGRFRLRELNPDGIFILGLDLGGPRGTVRLVDDTPSRGSVRDLGDVILEPCVTLTGTVEDYDGVPVPDARVRATVIPGLAFQFGAQNVREDMSVVGDNEFSGNSDYMLLSMPAGVRQFIERFPVPTTFTAEDGSFELVGAPVGLVTILVDKENFVTLPYGPVPSGAAGGKRSVGTLTLDEGDEMSVVAVDTEGNPLSDVEILAGPVVSLGSDAGAIVWPRGVTDESGRALLLGVSDDEHFVAGQQDGNSPAAIVRDAFAGGPEVVLTFPATRSLTIRATDPDGEVLSDLKVRVTEYPSGMGVAYYMLGSGMPSRGKVAKKEGGATVVTGLASKEYSFSVTAPGFAAFHSEVDLSKGSQEETVTLVSERVLDVLVLAGKEGHPVSHAKVVLANDDDAFEFSESLWSVGHTGSDGRTRLRGLPPASKNSGGNPHVFVTHPAYADQKQPVKNDAIELTMTLWPGGSIAGQVHKGGNTPDRPRFVSLSGYSEEASVNQMPRFVVTDLDGRFSFEGLAPGGYMLNVNTRVANEMGLVGLMEGMFSFGASEGEAEVQVAEGKESEVLIDLLGGDGDGPSGWLTGRVLLNGRPLVRGQVTGHAADTWSGLRSTRTDEAGRFDLGQVGVGDDGSVRVIVSPQDSPGGSPWGGGFYQRSVNLGEGQSRDVLIEIEAGSLEGRVVRRDNGRPIAAAEVRVETMGVRNGRRDQKGREEWKRQNLEKGNPKVRMEVFTDRFGVFSFDPLPAGEYRVRVDVESPKENFVREEVLNVIVPKRGTASPLTVQVSSAVPVEISVVLPSVPSDARPRINFKPSEGTGRTVGHRLTHQSGDTWLYESDDDLRSGAYSVSIYYSVPDGTGDSSFKMSDEQFEDEVTIPEGGARGLVLHPRPMENEHSGHQ